MNHDAAREKVKRHRSMYKRILSAFVDLVNSLELAKPLIAIEWPRSCTYWNDTAVDKFVTRSNRAIVNVSERNILTIFGGQRRTSRT